MNYKYKTKPVVKEAFQMTEARRWDNSEWPNWLNQAWQQGPGEGTMWIDPDDPKKERLALGTLEGVHLVTWGDYIIQGLKGELYPCKPDIFERTYEPVVEESGLGEGDFGGASPSGVGG